MIEQDGGDVVVHLYDKNGLENGRIKILNYKAENLQDPESDGTFTFYAELRVFILSKRPAVERAFFMDDCLIIRFSA